MMCKVKCRMENVELNNNNNKQQVWFIPLVDKHVGGR